MIKIKRLDHIQLCIPKGKEAEAKTFYSNILRLKEIPKPEPLLKNGGFWYQLEDIQLHIGIEETIPKTKQHPAFEVEDFYQAKEYLKSKGIKIKESISIDGLERFDCFDPFGNRIEFLEKTNPDKTPEVKAFWKRFVSEHKEYASHSFPIVDGFCDTKKAADECALLVQKEIKTATCSSLFEYQIEQEAIPQVDDLYIITNWDGEPTSIIKNTIVEIRKFKDIDASFARSEGEGDLSLEYWQKGHRAFFERLLSKFGVAFSEDLKLVCESFEMIYSN